MDPDDIDCSICLFERMQVVLPCGHAFCEDCITDWLKRERECPMCRENIGASFKDDGFFELIDLDGKDDVLSNLENQIEI